jgi:hypothetical protein
MSLRGFYWDLNEFLPVIGRNLVRLEIEVTCAEEFELIIQYCLNLQQLDIGGVVAGGKC